MGVNFNGEMFVLLPPDIDGLQLTQSRVYLHLRNVNVSESAESYEIQWAIIEPLSCLSSDWICERRKVTVQYKYLPQNSRVTGKVAAQVVDYGRKHGITYLKGIPTRC